MDIQKTKEKIIEHLQASEDESLLRQIQTIIDTNSSIAGYRPDGSPVTYGMLRESISESDQEFKKGGGINTETLKEEVKKWRSTKSR